MANANNTKRVLVKDFGFMALEKRVSEYGSGKNKKVYINFSLGNKKLTADGYEVERGVNIPGEFGTEAYQNILVQAVQAIFEHQKEVAAKAREEKKALIEPIEAKIATAKKVLEVYKSTPDAFEKQIADTEKQIESLESEKTLILNS